MRLVRPDDQPDPFPHAGAPVRVTVQVRDGSGHVVSEIYVDVSSPSGSVVSVTSPRAAKPAGEQGRSPHQLRIDPSGPTLSVLLDEYEQARRAADITTGHLHDCMSIVRDACQVMAWVFPGQITPAEITDYLNRRKIGGASPKYRNDIRSILLHFVDFLRLREAHGGIDPKSVPRARVKRRRARYCPTRDEVVRLIVAVTANWRKRDRWLVYLIAASTGLRMRTLSLLKPEYFKRGLGLAWLDLPAETVKNGEATHIWLTRECAERIEAHIAAGGGRNGRLLSAVPKWDHFEGDLKLAGLSKRASPEAPTFSRHSLRHFAATWLRSADRFSDQERASQMGHRTIAMTTQVYTDEAALAVGQKIWSMQPLLPSGFSGSRGRRVSKSAQEGLAKSRDLGQYQHAKSRDDREQPPDSISTPPAPPQLRPGFGDSGSRDFAGGLDVESLSGEPPGSDSLAMSQGERFESAHPDLVAKAPRLVRGSSGRLEAAMEAVTRAQANLISVLLEERRNVRTDDSPASSDESEDRLLERGPPPSGGGG